MEIWSQLPKEKINRGRKNWRRWWSRMEFCGPFVIWAHSLSQPKQRISAQFGLFYDLILLLNSVWIEKRTQMVRSLIDYMTYDVCVHSFRLVWRRKWFINQNDDRRLTKPNRCSRKNEREPILTYWWHMWRSLSMRLHHLHPFVGRKGLHRVWGVRKRVENQFYLPKRLFKSFKRRAHTILTSAGAVAQPYANG